MCGRYASARSVQDLAVAFGIREDRVEADVAADWNVAPTKPIVAVLDRGAGVVLTTVRWGLVPSWAEDPSIGSRMINARLETAFEKPAFRPALEARRCLIPADGWFEWSTLPDGTRQPFYLSPEDGGLLAFAGLWEVWRDAEGRPLPTATILTGPAPADLRDLHDRAPVVLPPDAWRGWLDRDSDLDDVRRLVQPTPPGVVQPRPVSPAVGDVRANGSELLEPVTVVEQPPLF
ncbi:MAG TPA: SOS response-associated peptidase [Mycobacteriales bacterium]|jgi:putative SOS response-associated peptidase YedK|nr:SOS response-associated peptidase [Mycobacteriales bacterium]